MLLSFTAPETLDVARVGGKGFGLARATQAGLPVPEGVILPTDAYRAWIAPHRDEIAARLAAHDTPQAKRAAVVEYLQQQPLPDDLATALAALPPHD